MTAPVTRAVKTDAVMALLFAAFFVWTQYAAYVAVAETVRRYGRNTDSGAFEYMAGYFYFAPVTLLFVAAAINQWRGSRWGRVMHWSAVSYAAAPLCFIAIHLLQSAL